MGQAPYQGRSMKKSTLGQSVQDLIDKVKNQTKTVEDWLKEVDYSEKYSYVPSEFAMKFVDMIQLIHGTEGTQNVTPEVHLRVLDNFITDKNFVVNMMHRGFGKSTLIKYLFFYLGIYEELPNFGMVNFLIYVSDSMDNGISVMRRDIDHTYENSEFLQKVMKLKTTEDRWEMTNSHGFKLVIRGYGAKSGIRGTREQGKRPQIAILDDLLSDDDARSPTILASIEANVESAITYALDPTRRKVFWMGTPFHAGDPLYKAVESGAWEVNLYPVCEEFPVEREDFRGSWEDRFSYDYVLEQYLKAVATGNVSSFNQELMLRIMSDEDRLISESDVMYYDRNSVMRHLDTFNVYFTTDFATTDKQAADFNIIHAWAVNYNGDYFWLGGICKRQTIDKTFEDLFRLNSLYKPLSVGMEVTGQQEGFVTLIQREMGRRNQFFSLASQGNNNRPGIRPTANKLQRFNTVVPLFKAHKIYLPYEVHTAEDKEALKELKNELFLACVGGFKSKHDDSIDGVSMLSAMPIYFPDEPVYMAEGDDGIYHFPSKHNKQVHYLDNYIV